MARKFTSWPAFEERRKPAMRTWTRRGCRTETSLGESESLCAAPGLSEWISTSARVKSPSSAARPFGVFRSQKRTFLPPAVRR